MTATTPRPGPPPLPPDDLATGSLPRHSLKAGTRLYRIHRTEHGALLYGPRSGPSDRGRWDAPNGEFGTCYFAEDPRVAFAETLLHDLEIDVLDEAEFRVRSLAVFEVVSELTLVRFHGGRAFRRLGASAASVHASYDVTGSWALALHAHPEKPAGIRHHARTDDDEFSIALFDGTKRHLRLLTDTPVLAPSLAPLVAQWLDHYELALISSTAEAGASDRPKG